MFVNGTKNAKIADSDFVLCVSSLHGGGLEMRYSNTKENDYFAIQSTRFVDCSAMDSSSDSGRIEPHVINATCSCHSCLFTHCIANRSSGALYFYFNSSGGQADFPIIFCFFHGNQATYGNDLCFASEPSDSPCFHCVTTDNSKTVGYVGGGYKRKQIEWLPLTHINVYLDASSYTHNALVIHKNCDSELYSFTVRGRKLRVNLGNIN